MEEPLIEAKNPNVESTGSQEEEEYENKEQILVMNQSFFYNDKNDAKAETPIAKKSPDQSEIIFVNKFNNFIKYLLIT